MAEINQFFNYKTMTRYFILLVSIILVSNSEITVYVYRHFLSTSGQVRTEL